MGASATPLAVASPLQRGRSASNHEPPALPIVGLRQPRKQPGCQSPTSPSDSSRQHSKERAYELRDTQVRGLLLRVQPSGHKAWVVTWEHGKRRTLGSAGHLTLDEAREIARKIIAEYIQTGLPSIAKPAAPKITLAEFLRDHYRRGARSELKGADKYISRLKRVFPGRGRHAHV